MSFQERTATLRFFRDLHDAALSHKARFWDEYEADVSRRREDQGTTYLYDIRKESQHRLQDEADQNLLYNITQFLIDCRAQLAQRQEDQRIALETPSANEVFRVVPDLLALRESFLARRRVPSSRSDRSPSQLQPRDSTSFTTSGHTVFGDVLSPASEASGSGYGPRNGRVQEGSSRVADDDSVVLVGCDVASFVDVLSSILLKEEERVRGPLPTSPLAGSDDARRLPSSPSRSGMLRRSSTLKRSSSVYAGRMHAKALTKLFNAIDVDGCGVITWEQFLAYCSRTRLGGEEALEEQREGKLCLSRYLETNASPKVGLGKRIDSGTVQYVPSAHLIAVLTTTTIDGTTISSVVMLQLYSTATLALLHEHEVPASTTSAIYIPGGRDAGDHIGWFTSGCRFQAMRVQPQPSRGTVDLTPVLGAANGIQVPHAPVHTLFHAPSRRVYGASLKGELFAFDVGVLLKPFRIQQATSYHPIFSEPITTLNQSSDGSILFLSCLFGGVAVFVPHKDRVTHQYIATFHGEPVSIRAMAYIETANVFVTCGKSDQLHLWMSAPNHDVDPYVGTLKHDSDPHVPDVVAVWSEPTVSSNAIVSLDRSGTTKLWDTRQNICISSESFTIDGEAPSGCWIEGCSLGPRGTMFFLSGSARTHHCLLTGIVLGRKMMNPIASATKEDTAHCCGVQLFDDEQTAVITVDSTLVVFDLKDGTVSNFYPSITPGTLSLLNPTSNESVAPNHITSVALLPGFRKVLFGTKQGQLRCHALTSGDICGTFVSLKREVSALTILQRQRLFVCASCELPELRIYAIPDRVAEKDVLHSAPPAAVVSLPSNFSVMCDRPRSGHATRDVVLVWDATGTMHHVSCEAPRFHLTSPKVTLFHNHVVNDTESPSAAHDAFAPLTTAEVNYHSERHVFRMLTNSQALSECEVTCCCDLQGDVSGMALAADSGSRLHVWSSDTHDIRRLKTWMHFSSRSIVAGVNKAVVCSVAFHVSSSTAGPAVTQPLLVTADDHGCICLWDLSQVLNPIVQTHPTDDEDHGSNTALDSLARAVFIRDCAVPLLHCFHIANEGIISVRRMRCFDAYCVTLTRGVVRFVTLTGSVAGDLIADPRYSGAPPPDFLLHRIDEIEEKKKPRQRTKANALWAKVRTHVIGTAKSMAAAARSMLKKSRLPRDLVDESADAMAAAEDDRIIGEVKKHEVYWPTPSNSPSKVRPVNNEIRVIRDIRKAESALRCLGDSRQRRPQLRVRLGSFGGNSDGEGSPRSRVTSLATANDLQSPSSSAASDGGRNAPSTVTLLYHLRSALRDLRKAAGASDDTTAVDLRRFLPASPALFPPSVFKALARRDPHLADVEDLPTSRPQWIETLVEHTPLPAVWSSALVDQQTLHLQALDLKNPLMAKYWAMQDENGDLLSAQVPPQGREGAATPTPTVSCGDRGEMEIDGSQVLSQSRRDGKVVDVVKYADMLVTSRVSKGPRRRMHSASHVKPSTGHPATDLPLELLLVASAPLYPIQESPFLQPGRAPPALSPYLFVSGSQSSTEPVPPAHSAPSSGASDPPEKLLVEQRTSRRTSGSFTESMKIVNRDTPLLHPEFITRSSSHGGTDMIGRGRVDDGGHMTSIKKSMTAPRHSWEARQEAHAIWASQFEDVQAPPSRPGSAASSISGPRVVPPRPHSSASAPRQALRGPVSRGVGLSHPPKRYTPPAGGHPGGSDHLVIASRCVVKARPRTPGPLSMPPASPPPESSVADEDPLVDPLNASVHVPVVSRSPTAAAATNRHATNFANMARDRLRGGTLLGSRLGEAITVHNDEKMFAV